MEFIENTFSGVKNPRQEVERGFRFWDTVSLSSPNFPLFDPASRPFSPFTALN
jgi:hypothetical protein